jgi:hypothetical protein
VGLGPRRYDPSTTRFSTADSYVSGGLDLGLALDPLTGNRYLFAGANPVAFYDDGHAPREELYREGKPYPRRPAPEERLHRYSRAELTEGARRRTTPSVRPSEPTEKPSCAFGAKADGGYKGNTVGRMGRAIYRHTELGVRACLIRFDASVSRLKAGSFIVRPDGGAASWEPTLDPLLASTATEPATPSR